MGMENTVAMYIRISLEDDDIRDGKGESNSVTNQRALLKKYISGREEFVGWTRMKRGEYIGLFGFFGYRKDPEDIHKLVIDEEAAAIVRRIFLMVGEGMRRNEVVKILNGENVPTSAVYKQKKGCTRDWFPEGKKKEPANKRNYSVIVCPHCGLTLRPGTQKESILAPRGGCTGTAHAAE